MQSAQSYTFKTKHRDIWEINQSVSPIMARVLPFQLWLLHAWIVIALSSSIETDKRNHVKDEKNGTK